MGCTKEEKKILEGLKKVISFQENKISNTFAMDLEIVLKDYFEEIRRY